MSCVQWVSAPCWTSRETPGGQRVGRTATCKHTLRNQKGTRLEAHNRLRSPPSAKSKASNTAQSLGVLSGWAGPPSLSAAVHTAVTGELAGLTVTELELHDSALRARTQA